ncbi:MAG: hypothetical protein WCD89_12860 [Anaerocolumna sp.]
MESANEKKTLTDYILLGLFIINLIVLFTFYVYNAFQDIQIIDLYVMFIIAFIVIPLKDYFKRGILKNKFVILSLIIRFGVGLIFSVTSYQVFLSNNYNLKYTYWIWFICFVSAILIFYFKSLSNDYKKRKLLEKQHNRIHIAGRILLLVLFICFLGYKSGRDFIQPQRQLILKDIKIPESISIYKHDATKQDIKPYLNSLITINDPDDLRVITKEFEAVRIVNITSTDRINYERMRADNLCYYNMIFDYGDIKGEKLELKNGYVNCLEVTGNGNAAITYMNRYNGLIFGEQYYREIYPINISKKIADLIFVYINKNQ